MRQRRCDPLQHPGVARREHVHRGHHAVVPRVTEDRRGGVPAEELGTAQVQVGRPRDRVEVDVVEGVGAVGADAVPGGAVPVGPDRDHARRGLHALAPHQPRGVDARCAEQRDQGVPEGVGADRTHAAGGCPQLRQDRGRPSRGPGRGHHDVVHERSLGAVGDALDCTHVHIEDMHAQGDDVHGHQVSFSVRGRVDPYLRSTAAVITAACWSVSSERGMPRTQASR